jgi:putative ABC transport system permease protein
LGLIGSFSVCALLLAAVGVYGVTSYAVARRTHELGIRIALGATPRDALALIVRHALILASTGIILGALGALLLTRLFAKLLYATSPTDAAVFVGVPAILLVVAVVASYLPARRAARVDPAVALRAE